MALMVSVIRRDPNINRDGWEEEHEKHFGRFASVPKVIPSTTTPGEAVVVGEVHDLEGLRAYSRTPEGDAFMRKWGFIEQIGFFAEV